MNTMNRCEEYYFSGLIKIIQDGERVSVAITRKENTYHIVDANCTEKPNISFRIQNSCFVLPNMYLRNESIGTGTRIFSWIIDFCRKHEINIFEVRIVRKENLKMQCLCQKFKMEKIEQSDYFDYKLRITSG